MTQMIKLSCTYGAPMGRHESTTPHADDKIRVFKVRLDSGGYDDGGAYWGSGEPLYCIDDPSDNLKQFVRANSRFDACVKANVDVWRMASPIKTSRYIWANTFSGSINDWALYHYRDMVKPIGFYCGKNGAIEAAIDHRADELGL